MLAVISALAPLSLTSANTRSRALLTPAIVCPLWLVVTTLEYDLKYDKPAVTEL